MKDFWTRKRREQKEEIGGETNQNELLEFIRSEMDGLDA